ncbi:hypothetical protein [Rhizobium sp. BK251]|uniref:hypothetical protein n=1 Tax=Rhizobium sp. BK251 TaxID=2512125 RepID=UPI001053DD80|nr:hypothetical protein [Rhizobium sp. BK251]
MAGVSGRLSKLSDTETRGDGPLREGEIRMPTKHSRQDISGLWAQGVAEIADPALGDPATHGTYTRSIYLRLAHASAPADPAASAGAQASDLYPDCQMLYIFNEAGEMASFAWSDDFQTSNGAFQGAWVTYNHWLTFYGTAAALGGTDDLTLSIPPNLALRAPKDAAVPACFRDTGCPMASGTPTVDAKPIVGLGKAPPQLPTNLPARPLEYIRADDGNSLTWGQLGDQGAVAFEISLERAAAQPRPEDPKVDSGDTWGGIFVTSYPHADAVFVGYLPVGVDLTQGVMTSTKAGSWHGQSMSGPVIFKYPELKSQDFQKSPAGDGKFVPLGTIYSSLEAGQKNSSTLIVASTNQHSESTARTIGLEGGIEGAINASFSDTEENKTEEKSGQEFRYTQSAETFKKYALLRDPANLTLDEDYARLLSEKLLQLLPSVVEAATLVARGADPKTAKPTLSDNDWTNFEKNHGSHYANAATFGTVKSLKTILKEQTEGYLVEHTTKLKVKASAAFDGVTGGGNATVTSTWGTDFTNSINNQDLHEYSVGEEHSPAPIFLDLRPANELLNPVLFAWSADPLAEIDQVRAPFMWYLLRQHFLDYQRRQHKIGTPISALPDTDWSPKIVRFHASAQMIGPALTSTAPYGTIFWAPYGNAVVAANNSYYRKAVNAHNVSANSMLPGAEDLTCTLVADTATSAESGVVLTVNLRHSVLIGHDDGFEVVTLKMPMIGTDHQEADGRGYLSDPATGKLPDHVFVKLRREIVQPSM